MDIFFLTKKGKPEIGDLCFMSLRLKCELIHTCGVKVGT